MKRYFKIEIATNSLLKSDEYIAELSDIGFYAFEQQEHSLIAYIEENDLDQEQFAQIIPGNLVKKQELIEEENWNAKWEKDFTPVVVHDFAAIRAAFHKPFEDVKYDLLITPKMSFGTGHHPTTYLMVETMEHISFSNKTVLDFGTGTGVLAILAEKLGAQRVVAIDYDEWSIENTRENVEANNCSPIEVIQADEPQIEGKVEIILANINLHILKKYASQLSHLLQKDGILVASGFLKRDEEEMETSFAKFLMHVERRSYRDDWCCLIFKKD